MPASDGDVVRIHYRGTLADGTEFDSSEGREPLEFKVGEGSVIEGFDAGVAGSEVGEKRTVTIAPEQAYGAKNETLVQRIEADVFAEDPYVGGTSTSWRPTATRCPAS